jgi:hypothetical protein
MSYGLMIETNFDNCFEIVCRGRKIACRGRGSLLLLLLFIRPKAVLHLRVFYYETIILQKRRRQ